MRVGVAAKVFKIMGQRSSSGSDGHGNLVNSIASEKLKRFEQKLTQILIL